MSRRLDANNGLFPSLPLPSNATLTRRNIRDRQIPVPHEDFEAPLFFAFVGILIRPKLLDERFLVRICGRRDGGVLVTDGDAVIPATIFGGVVSGRLDLDRKHAAR